MTEKTVNYTADQTRELVEGYKAGKTVEMLAEATGRTVRSVIAKLSREGVYIAKSAKVAGEKRVTKADLVTKIAARLDVQREKLETLEKASHEALEILAEELTDMTGEPL